MILLAFYAALLANSVSIGSGTTLCNETNKCIITATSVPASFQFGIGTSWCSAITAPKLPLTVSWNTPNPALCATDPAVGIVKQLNAIQQSAAYTVSYTLNGVAQTFTVPAIAVTPPAKTVLKVLTCSGPVKITTYSDGSVEVESSTVVCK